MANLVRREKSFQFLEHVLFLQEKLSLIACTGILLTICGVAWVIAERTAETTLSSKHLWQGLGISLLGQTTHAVGAILSRAAFTQGHLVKDCGVR